jgi:predicted phage terminase large subunit-like protein
MKITPDFFADQEAVDSWYRDAQLRSAIAGGLGIVQSAEGPVGEMLDDALRLEASLAEYMRSAWMLLENRPMVWNWHLDAISEHLEAVTAGELLKLVINIPPRTMKSLSVSVFWPTWEWTTRPWTQWMFTSYHQNLSTRDCVKGRRLIQSPWYQDRWGHRFQLSGDQNAKTRYDNTRGGYRLGTSLGGFGTGEGGDRLVVDDPHNPKGSESETKRETTIEDYDSTMTTRLNDPTTGARVIMMQRLHQKDLTGHLLSKDDGWEHLMLPMRFDPERRCVTVLGFEDPRQEKDELLWPERFPLDVVKSQEKDLGPYGAAGQFQQQPVAREGGQFERKWFRLVDDVPKGHSMIRVRFWDLAGTEDAGAYTAGILVGVSLRDGRVFIEDVVRGQWAAGDRNRIIRETAELDAERYGVMHGGAWRRNKQAVLYRAEQEPGSGGKDQARAVVRALAGYRAEASPSSGDKFLRADPLAGAAKNGDVSVLVRQWTEDFLREMEAAGPGAEYLDQMDASAGAYNRAMELYDVQKAGSMQGVSMQTIEAMTAL